MYAILAATLLAAQTAAVPPAPHAAPASATQAVPAINVGDRLPGFDNLRAGTRTYLRYRVMNGVWRPVDIWRREIRFDDQQGVRRLHIVQSWTGSIGAPTNLSVDSWFEMGTFAPISHERRAVRAAEETRNEGFLFAPTRVEALPSTPSNSRAAFTLDTPQRFFNFETDMETLQTLPLAAGYAARLHFYHPGGPPPADWVFKVVGSARLPVGTGTVDSWIVTLDSADAPSGPPSRFFVAKQGQQVLRVEQPAPDGSMFVKVLIDGGAPIPG